MENSQHIKSLSTDPRGKNRIRYKSSRQRAKRASADVYRSYKRRLGVTSAASREERVHHPQQEETGPKRKRQRTKLNSNQEDSSSRVAILHDVQQDLDAEDGSDLDTDSTFASELDIAKERNGSEIFNRFYREVWHLSRSLPEVLHHSNEIMQLLYSYVLSPESDPSSESPSVNEIPSLGVRRDAFVVNHATTDILHLMAVFARDLRHEIHPYVHTLIVPRIVYDLLNPPLPPLDSGKQPLALDVTVVEAAFRMISYVFRYDTEPLLSEVEKEGQEPCLEKLRQYYGATLAHKRDYVRRLAAQTFSPMIRKLKSDASRRRHLRRVMRALAASTASMKASSEGPISERLTRSQTDAVDGISLLFFETARGIRGQLHSKGTVIIRCLLDCMTSTNNESGVVILHLVAASVLERLWHHYLQPDAFAAVWKEMFRSIKGVLVDFPKLLDGASEEKPIAIWSVLASTVKLFVQIISFGGDGRILKGSEKNVTGLIDVMEQLMVVEIFEEMPQSLQVLALQLLCFAWKCLPDHPLFVSRLGDKLVPILSCSRNKSDQQLSSILARELLPFLPPAVGIKYIGKALLSVAAETSDRDPIGSLMVLFAVSGTRPMEGKNKNSPESEDSDDLFYLEKASYCTISCKEKDKLMDVCLINASVDRQSNYRDLLARLAVAARCLPFLALAGSDEEEEQEEKLPRYQKKIWNWALHSIKALDKFKQQEPGNSPDLDLVVTKSLLLQSFTRLIAATGHTLPSTKKQLQKLRPFAENLIFKFPKSLWAVQGVASFVEAASIFDVRLSEKTSDVFDALTPNLRSQSHFLRLHTIQILASLPARPFVTDHAQIDWTDDLDEEPSHQPPKSTSAQDGAAFSSEPSGLCDIIETLLTVESTPVNLENERRIMTCISRVEVLGRTGRIPVLDADAAANHMLGILNIKFSRIWPASVRALVALATGHEHSVWLPLETKLRETLSTLGDARDETDSMQKSDGVLSYMDHLNLCVAWDKSTGDDSSLFVDNIVTAEAEGRISRHLCTDKNKVFEFVWSVLEQAPELAAKHSRFVVPAFIEFLYSQYFFFFDQDPDARELCLQDEVDDPPSFPRDALNRKFLQDRLQCFLNVFAAVNGPRQLYKHSLLLSVFIAFLSHQETSIAQASLSCILKFKLPYVVPYGDQLKSMLTKGELRETMLKFNISEEDGVIDSTHRFDLIPLVTRILFGRLSSRVSVGKSKETPAARRMAVLSFISVLGQNDEELYPLFYLMMRSYIPEKQVLSPVEKHKKEDTQTILSWLNAIQVDDVSRLPDQRHEGFLNLVSAVFAQLGHSVTRYLPSVMSVLLTLSKYSEASKSSLETSPESSFEIERPLVRHDPSTKLPARSRLGSIRTLCFRRLGDCFEQYADVFDFLPYAPTLWNSISLSLSGLPESAASAEKAPALLSMLECMACHATLIPLLSAHDDAVKSVIECITERSSHHIMNSTLNFLDGLLTNGGTALDDSSNDHNGIRLIERYIALLLRQFSVRLESTQATAASERTTPASRKENRNQTTWRELSILCRVSRIVEEEPDDDEASKENNQVVLETLVDLLIAFLGPNKKVNEIDQLNVIEILSKLLPRVGKDSALAHLPTLSKTLGPHKCQRGIESLTIRRSLALLLQRLSTCKGVPPQLVRIANVSFQLCAVQSQRVDEMNYEEVLAALSDLSADQSSRASWLGLCSDECEDPTLLVPIIQICFHLLHDDDGVVSRGAFKAIKTLITVAANKSSDQMTTTQAGDSCSLDKWAKIVETGIVPHVRAGLAARTPQARRMFILLLAEVARSFKDSPSQNLYGDLSCLIQDDEPDKDFFQAITHVQLHRRTRALQRLRKMLSADDIYKSLGLRAQSLSNILLPLAIHPVYECKTNLEEPLAMEATEAVGAIAKHLSWSKYQTTLWTTLTQVQRHPEQERYLIGMVCSMLDSFHFDLRADCLSNRNSVNTEDVESPTRNAVWRALENRIIPKTESLLTKEKVSKGEKVKILRSPVVLALLKLFQKFPRSFFNTRLPMLLATICDSLKNQNSDTRDAARTTLAKMVVSMDLTHLAEVIQHLGRTLKHGYQLHVRMATLHTVLLQLSETYERPAVTSSQPEHSFPFDQSIPGMMDLIQEDLFGTANERKELEGTRIRFVKEASGSKSNDSIEIICRLLYFRPSFAASCEYNQIFVKSSVHAVVSPLLERLGGSECDVVTIGRTRECLNRVVVGLSQNTSTTPQELFPFVYASIHPFIGSAATLAPDDDSISSNSDDEDNGGRIHISKTNSKDKPVVQNPRGGNPKVQKSKKVVEWRPSTKDRPTNAKGARDAKLKDNRDLRRVQDGSSAPRLTGSSRYASVRVSSTQDVNNPANICAVNFGLQLLYSTLKKQKLGRRDLVIENMLDPFVPLLTTCVCTCSDNSVILLSLRCLGSLLRFKLQSVENCSKELGTQTLDILTASGALSNLNQELTQACFKTLTLLISLDSRPPEIAGEDKSFESPSVALDNSQMDALISLLKGAAVDSEHHNPTFGLIKAITSRRYVSPEFYDLMETCLELSVRSQKLAVRQLSAGIFLQYLLDYPIGKQRLEGHLKQVVLNVKYEYEEGRLSAIGLVSATVEKLPIPLLEEHAQLFFLPLVLQLVNDESKECREAVAKCLERLLGRAPIDVVQTFYDYAVRWSQGTGALQRTSLQLFGIFVDSRLDFLKRGDTASCLVDQLCEALRQSNSDGEWEARYFSLISLEKVIRHFPAALEPSFVDVVGCLGHPHPWVKRVSSRLVGAQLRTMDPSSLTSDQEVNLLKQSGLLFDVTRNLCTHLGMDETYQDEELTDSAIKSLSWLVQAMTNYRRLFVTDENEEDEARPDRWLLTRLSQIAKLRGTKRRSGVFKCFAALATCGGPALVNPHLELMLEPLQRSIVESENVSRGAENSFLRNRKVDEPAETVLARDVLQLLEKLCSDQNDLFLNALVNVKAKAREKKEKRKQEVASEAIINPQAAAQRKAKKYEHEKKRRKRRVEDHRTHRGSIAKPRFS